MPEGAVVEDQNTSILEFACTVLMGYDDDVEVPDDCVRFAIDNDDF